MRETTVKHGRLTWRRWYGRNMRLHSAFEQQKGSGLVFGGFWGHSRLWPPNQKKASLDPFHENMVRKVYMAKISGPYQLFYGTLFFLADANFPTDNPSHTDKPCLLWIRPIQITSGVCSSSNVTMIDLEKRKRYSFHQADQIILKPPNVISQIRFLVQRNLRRRV